jgi:hypothetical protein
MWGTAPVRARPKPPKRPLDPKSLRAGHQGIAWLHVAGVAIWALVALVFGALILAGRDVPGVLVIASIGAGVAHGLFLLAHLWLARAAGRKVLAAAAPRREPE